MTWVLVAVVVILFLVLGFAGWRGEFIPWHPASPSATGVEGARRLGKKTRAALDAATTMLR
jgi:hypothetical protein